MIILPKTTQKMYKWQVVLKIWQVNLGHKNIWPEYQILIRENKRKYASPSVKRKKWAKLEG